MKESARSGHASLSGSGSRNVDNTGHREGGWAKAGAAALKRCAPRNQNGLCSIRSTRRARTIENQSSRAKRQIAGIGRIRVQHGNGEHNGIAVLNVVLILGDVDAEVVRSATRR